MTPLQNTIASTTLLDVRGVLFAVSGKTKFLSIRFAGGLHGVCTAQRGMFGGYASASVLIGMTTDACWTPVADAPGSPGDQGARPVGFGGVNA